MMEQTDWDAVLQFATDTLDVALVAEKDGDDASRSSLHQMPTPPESHVGSPILKDSALESNLVSVSTTFFPGAQHHPLPSDTMFLSADSVFFYVHRSSLLVASNNAFGNLLSTAPNKDHSHTLVHVPETSTELNIILHIMYGMSCAHYSPSLEALAVAVSRLPYYGVSPKELVVPSNPLYPVLLSHAARYPFEVYALAASFDIYDLAVAVSTHLLSFPLSNITDEMAEKIGPVYLKRLFFLHFGRTEALKRVLLPPPQPHPPTPECDLSEQKKLTRAWALASAYLAWDARPDLSTSTMECALRPLTEHLTCEQCQQVFSTRIKELVVQWSLVKRTI